MSNFVFTFENIVIGHNQEAVKYAYNQKYKLIFDELKFPLPWKRPGFVPEETLCVERLYEKMVVRLSLDGYTPFGNKSINGIRIENDGEFIKIPTSFGSLLKVKCIGELHIFNTRKIDGIEHLCIGEKNPPNKNIVLDWFTVEEGIKHKYSRLTNVNLLARYIYFFPSPRKINKVIKENQKIEKDLICVSFLNDEELEDIYCTEFMVEKMLHRIIKLKTNIKDFKANFKRREVRAAENKIFKNQGKIVFHV